MPHVPAVDPTSHDSHDRLLVAALAAGDLAATDRDRAAALTRSCPDCLALHDDLRAIARAVATVPPPFAPSPRDFRLTFSDAARLRSAGWRRIVAAFRDRRSAVTRPLGLGLATLGLVGLIFGNVQLGAVGSGGTMLSTAGSPRAAGSGSSPAEAGTKGAVTDVAAPAASNVAAPGNVAAPVASAAAASCGGACPAELGFSPLPPTPAGPGATGGPSASGREADIPAATGPTGPIASRATTPTSGQVGGSTDSSGGGVSVDPVRPLNILFGGAIVVGLGLLLWSSRRGRRSA